MSSENFLSANQNLIKNESGLAKENLSPLDNLNRSLEDISNGFNALGQQVNHFFNTEEGRIVKGRLDVGQRSGEADNTWGVTGQEAQVFSGDWRPNGNAEGSLYTLFDGDKGKTILRIRIDQEKEVDLFYGTTVGKKVAVRLVMEKRENESAYSLKPESINGNKILSIDEKGILVPDPDDFERYHKADMEWFHAWSAYDDQKRAGVIDLTNPNLVEPIKPEQKQKVIPLADLEATLGDVREGFKRTLSTVTEQIPVESKLKMIE